MSIITESRQASIREVQIHNVLPSPENDTLYRPVDVDDPEIVALAESITKHGIREPLVISLDGYLLSGHRRRVAAKLAGLHTVPCRVELIHRADEPDRFLVLLREHNRQREKSLDEKLREEIVVQSPDEAYAALLAHRRAKARLDVNEIELIGKKTRAAISPAKKPFLDAITLVLVNRKDFWPLSDRTIHYALLNKPPLRHASKPDSTYANNRQSYQDLVDLLTRARLTGEIPWNAIADPTRPVAVWTVWQNAQPFIRDQVDGLFKGYFRDLLQSQPNHIEIVGEKNTIDGIIRPVAMEYCIPMTIGRGYSSSPPRYEMAQRFHKSGKEKLILLMLSDFDPDGEEIAHSFARSMRDDFFIDTVVPMKVALTSEQVAHFKLQPVMTVKESSTNAAKFTKKHGKHVFELEALEPAEMQALLREAIDGVLDIDAFNRELDAEKHDAAFLANIRARTAAIMKEAMR